MTFLKKVSLIAMLMAAPVAALAQSAEQKGEEIVQRAQAAGQGWGDSSSSGQMILYTQGGAQSERRFNAKGLEGRGNNPSASLLVFEWPGDVRDTALLTYSYDNKADDQWLYLPSVGRVKRISSSARSGSFMGSEFAYEDMTDQGPDDFNHKWVQDGPCPVGGGTCHVIDRTPKQRSGYALQRVWMNASNLYVVQVQYFDRAGKHVKTLQSSGQKKYQGKYWRPAKMRMVNHLTGKSTDLLWSGYKFGNGFSANDFSVQALKSR